MVNLSWDNVEEILSLYDDGEAYDKLAAFVFRTFTIMKLWNWFLVPLTNVNQASFYAIAGLCSLISLYTWTLPSRYAEKDKLEQSVFWRITLAIVRECSACGTALFLGWMFNSLM